MKKVLLILGVLILIFAGYLLWIFKLKPGPKRDKGPEPVPLTVSKHSETFNNSVQSVLNSYFELTESFVKWDSVAVDKSATELKTALDSLKIEELKVDTTGIYESAMDPHSNVRNEVNNIMAAPNLTGKRQAFNQLSEQLRILLLVVKYDRAKLYWQECPMAFNDEIPGYWLSRTDSVRNPYMGLKHPMYHAGMLECGGPKDTINFIGK